MCAGTPLSYIRGGMLLAVATSHHHGTLALLDARDGLQVALFYLWTPDDKRAPPPLT